MSNNHKTSVLSIAGYLVWFAILVRLLYLATNDQSSGAESLGLHLGVGLSLLALLGIPCFIIHLRAKRRGESASWLLIMMWTTIIALLLAVGGFYGRLHTSTKPEQAVANISPENQQPQPEAPTADTRESNSQPPAAQPTTPDYFLPPAPPQQYEWTPVGNSGQYFITVYGLQIEDGKISTWARMPAPTQVSGYQITDYIHRVTFNCKESTTTITQVYSVDTQGQATLISREASTTPIKQNSIMGIAYSFFCQKFQ